MAKSAVTAIRHTERVAQALELRRAGCTYDEIGRTMGCTRQRARELVLKGIGQLLALSTKVADELRALELARLDGLVAAHWPQRGNPRNAEIILKTIERRCALLGLDAPVKVAETTPTGEPLPPALDLSRLTTNKLRTLLELYAKAKDVQESEAK